MVPVKPTLTSTAGFVSTFDRQRLLLGMLTRLKGKITLNIAI